MSQAIAYTVSPELLARDDFRAACRMRDFGRVFKLMRQYDGASQDRICSPVEGLTQSRVSKIMRGDDRVATLDLIERIIDALRIPGDYVGLATRDWEARALDGESSTAVVALAAPALVSTNPTARLVRSLRSAASTTSVIWCTDQRVWCTPRAVMSAQGEGPAPWPLRRSVGWQL